MDGHVERMGYKKTLVVNAEAMRRLGGTTHGLECNVKETECEAIEWTHLAMAQTESSGRFLC